MSYILFFDTETTGLPRDHKAPASDVQNWPRVVQIAWSTYSLEGHLLDEEATLVRPEGFIVPPESTRIHGISHADALREGLSLADMLDRFQAALSDAGRVVGHNVDFDRKVVEAEFLRAGRLPPFDGLPTTCTMEVGLAYVRDRGVRGGKWPTLAELFESMFGQPLRDAGEDHDAAVDTKATADCYWRLVDEGYTSPSAPQTNTRPPTPPAVVAGGDADDLLAGAWSVPSGDTTGKETAAWEASYFIDEFDAVLVKQGVPQSALRRFQHRVAPFEVRGLPAAVPRGNVDPTLAVAHNYVVRGLPTRASLALGSTFLRHAFREAFLDTQESDAPTVTLDLHGAAVSGLDAAEFGAVLRRYPEVSLKDVAEQHGTAAHRALGLLLDLSLAAQVQRTLLLAAVHLRAPLAERALRVHVAGRPLSWTEPVVDDLDDLLRHLYALRNGEASSVLLVSTEDSSSADVVVRLPGSPPPAGSGTGISISLTPTPEPPGPETTKPQDGAEGPAVRLTPLAMADPISYPSLGSVVDVPGDTQLGQAFSFESLPVRDALVYLLQNAFRKRAFRPGQIPIADRALQGLDVVGLLPTGGGKSLTYQLCGLLQPGVTVVVDPINSLMRDQHDKLVENGITACVYVNAFNSRDERNENMDRISRGELLFAFVSPERFQIERFRSALSACRPNRVSFAYAVIDEAHCVSEWGHDFRHSYLRLAENLRRFCPTRRDRLPTFGLTATASFDVLADVQRELDMGDDAIVTLPPRPLTGRSFTSAFSRLRPMCPQAFRSSSARES